MWSRPAPPCSSGTVTPSTPSSASARSVSIGTWWLGIPLGRVGRDLAPAELADERLHLALRIGQLGDHGPNGGTMGGMAEPEPALRLDVPRAEALAYATDLIARAWESFDHARPEQPPVDEALRAALAAPIALGPMPVLQALEEAAVVLDHSHSPAAAALLRVRRVLRPRDRGARRCARGLPRRQPRRRLRRGRPRRAPDARVARPGLRLSRRDRHVLERRHRLEHDRALGRARARAARLAPQRPLGRARARSTPRPTCTSRSSAPPSCSASAATACARSRSTPTGACSVDACAAAIDADRAAGVAPIAVVATAGTTLTGAVDPLDGLADVCEARGVWLHVDGAYGLPAALVESHAPLFAGLARADSVTRRRAQVALRPEGLRRAHGARGRVARARLQPRGDLRAARAGRARLRRPHARVLAAVPRAQALARAARARPRGVPHRDRAQPRRGAPVRRPRRGAPRARAARRARALGRPLPPRRDGQAARRAQPRARRGAAGRRPRLRLGRRHRRHRLPAPLLRELPDERRTTSACCATSCSSSAPSSPERCARRGAPGWMPA